MARPVFKARGSSGEAPFSVECEAGDRIFAEGDLGTEMYVIQAGQVEITQEVEGEQQAPAVLEKDDSFGEMAILEGLARTVTAVAIEPTRVVRINASTFGQMLLESSEVLIRMMRKLSRCVRLAKELLSEVGVPSYRGVRALAEPVPEPTSSSQHLLHEESGEKFYLVTDGAARVGREDPVTGIDPEIDLSSIEEQRSTSRRHATIRVENGNDYLVEEIGTTNGTYVKEERLKTDVPVQIEDGDHFASDSSS